MFCFGITNAATLSRHLVIHASVVFNAVIHTEGTEDVFLIFWACNSVCIRFLFLLAVPIKSPPGPELLHRRREKVCHGRGSDRRPQLSTTNERDHCRYNEATLYAGQAESEPVLIPYWAF